MHKSKVIELLKGFSKSELKEFDLFVQSPFYNRNEKVTKFYQYIYPFINHDKEEKALNKEKVYKKVFGAGPVKDNELAYIMTSLARLIEEYYVCIEIEKRKADKQLLILEGFKSHNQDKNFFSLVKKMDSMLEKSDTRDHEYLLNKYRLNYAQLIHPQTSKITPTLDSLKESMEYLDLYFIYFKMKFTCVYFNRKGIYSDETEGISFMKEILENSDNAFLKPYAFPGIFKLIIQFFEENNSKNYYQLKESVESNLSQFGFSEQQDIFNWLINCASRRQFSEVNDYYDELFALYKFGLEKEILFENGLLDKLIVRNIVTLSCNLKAYDWLENFLSECEDKIASHDKISSIALGKAHLQYSRGDYQGTIELLRDIEFLDHWDILIGKFLQFKSFYEVAGYEEVFFDFFNSFSMFLRRNKVWSKSKTEGFLNFIKIARQLFRVKIINEEPKQELIEKWALMQNVAYKSWIDIKVSELLTKKGRPAFRTAPN